MASMSPVSMTSRVTRRSASSCVAPGSTSCTADAAAGEPHLQLLHSHLMLRYRDHCRRQGAWDFPRQFGRLWNRHGERLLGSPKMPRRAT